MSITVRVNSTGTSVSVYDHARYLGSVIFVSHGSFSGAYTPPDCRNGCKSPGGCKSDGPCRHKDKAFHSMCEHPQLALDWLLGKHGMEPEQIEWDADFLAGKSKLVAPLGSHYFRPSQSQSQKDQDTFERTPVQRTQAAKPAPTPERKRVIDLGEQLKAAQEELE